MDVLADAGCLQLSSLAQVPDTNDSDVCVTVHHIWKWQEVPTWCNNYDLLS